MDTLKMTLHRKWFIKIVIGRKRYEFREVKPFWTKRLTKNDYKFIEFTNGYSATDPFMKIEFKSVQIRRIKGVDMFCIELGQIIQLRNMERLKDYKIKKEDWTLFGLQ